MKDFPILERKINGKKIVYLDSAATTQKPKQVIDAISRYYEKSNSNVHRGVYTLSEEATKIYEDSRKRVAGFVGVKPEQIVFTRNTTESLNLLAYSLMKNLDQGDEIILTEMEHHSNLVPWQQLAKEKGVKLKFVPVNKDGTLDMKAYGELFTNKTKIVSSIHVSNVLGTVNPAKAMAEIAHKHSCLFVLDAAQSVPHMKVDFEGLGVDFAAFSGHKMLGPMGIGALYVKEPDKLKPFLYGGDMILDVSLEETKFNKPPWKFEAGTPNVADAAGLAAAVEYLEEYGMENVWKHEQEITRRAMQELGRIEGLTMYGPKIRAGVIAFNIEGVHPQDLAALLDEDGICIRVGHHCAMPLIKKLGLKGAARASFYIYNTKEDVDALAEGIRKAVKVLK